MFERSAWWSESFWPEPGVLMISTLRPSSRKKPSSRATSSGRSWIAFIIEALTFFSSAMAVLLGWFPWRVLLFAATGHATCGCAHSRYSSDVCQSRPNASHWQRGDSSRNGEQFFDRGAPRHHVLLLGKQGDGLQRLAVRRDAEREGVA